MDNKDLRFIMAPNRTLPFAVFFRMVKENEPPFVRCPKPATSATASTVRSEIEQLWKQMEELKTANEYLLKQNHKRKANGIRCYNCGDAGHMMRNCQKRAKRKPASKEKRHFLVGQTVRFQPSKGNRDVSSEQKLLNDIIGAASTNDIQVNGVNVKCLIETSSVISIISESFL